MSKEKPNIKDDGYEIHAGYRIRLLNSKAGKRYQVDLGRSTGKHIRLSFETLKAARKCAFEKSNEKKNHGVKVLGFTDKQRNDAVTALKILKPFGINLREAANFYAKHNQVVDHTNGTEQLVKRYLESQKQRMAVGELRERSYNECEKHLKKFRVSMEKMAVDTISATDIDEWLDKQNFGATSRNNHRRYISGFFNWCLEQDKIAANPVLRTRKVRKPTHTPNIYTTKDTEAIMKACEQFVVSTTKANGKRLAARKVKVEGKMVVPDKTTLIPYMAMAFFAGIRPNEICRLKWRDIDLQLGEIHVNAGTSKTSMARIVHISANLKKWLIPYRGDSSALVFPYSDTVLRSWRRAIFNDLDIKYIQDGARHSFATYYLALNSMDDTIQELGHTDTKMLFKHYRGLAKNRKNQAKAFFDIEPNEDAKVIHISKAV